VNVDGTGLAPLTGVTALGVRTSEPQWSPDGTRVVFSSSRKLDGTDAPGPVSTFNIWRVNADGTGLAPLTNATALGADSFSPQWSPDSARVVFESWDPRTLVANIWRVNSDGTGPVALTTATIAGSFVPQWSPDGAKVAFESSRKLDGTDAPNPNYTRNIWVVTTDGTGLAPLTNATARGAGSSSPVFSP